MRASRALPLLIFLNSLLGACAGAWPMGIPLTYRVGPLREFATLFPPAVPFESAGRRPLVLVLHGGFFGDGDHPAGVARRLAAQGILSAVPTYRGEPRTRDGARSDGRIEFCQGEVEDVLELLRELARRPDVDPDRIGLIGFSHGGCIALRAAERYPRLRALVTFAAPADPAATYRNLHDHPFAGLGFNGWLGGKVETYVGGPPAELPREWALRSPLPQASALTMPYLLVHGLSDDVVPVAQACLLEDALRQSGRCVQEHLFSPAGVEIPLAAPVCVPKAQAPTAPCHSKPRTEAWFFAGQTHTFSRRARESAEDRAVHFLYEELSR